MKRLVTLSLLVQLVMLFLVVYVTVCMTNINTAVQAQAREITEIQDKTMKGMRDEMRAMAELINFLYSVERYKGGVYWDPVKKELRYVRLKYDKDGSLVEKKSVPLKLDD